MILAVFCLWGVCRGRARGDAEQWFPSCTDPDWAACCSSRLDGFGLIAISIAAIVLEDAPSFPPEPRWISFATPWTNHRNGDILLYHLGGMVH